MEPSVDTFITTQKSFKTFWPWSILLIATICWRLSNVMSTACVSSLKDCLVGGLHVMFCISKKFCICCGIE